LIDGRQTSTTFSRRRAQRDVRCIFCFEMVTTFATTTSNV
jgi:hypothetical protein